MIGQQYTINAWGKTGKFLDVMICIYSGVAMYIISPKFKEIIDTIYYAIWRLV